MAESLDIIGDEFSKPFFNINLNDKVNIYEIPHTIDEPTNLDMYKLDLIDLRGNILESRFIYFNDTEYIIYEDSRLKIDTLGIIADVFGIQNGTYDLKVSGYRNYLHDEDEDGNIVNPATATVFEFSKSRLEVRVTEDTTIDDSNWFELFYQNQTPNTQPNGTVDQELIWPVILEFGNIKNTSGDTVKVISTNWQYHEYELPSNNNSTETKSADSIIFRTATPIPQEIRTNSRVSILRPLFLPYSIPVTINVPSYVDEEYVELRGPNLKNLAVGSQGKTTLLQSLTDITGTNSVVKQRLLDSFVSGSNTIELNYDFRKFDNFIHFSSAEERLNTFKYKVEQIEFYDSQSAFITTNQSGKSNSASTGSSFLVKEKQTNDRLKQEIISSFDPFENYLYYASHSLETIGDDIFPASTWPKSTSSKPYTLYSATSSEATTWFNERIASASFYDETNVNYLKRTIPLHIQVDPQNSKYLLFVDMIGHFYDELYYQVKQLEEINNRDESVYEGLSKDLVYDVAKSLGWTLQSGFDTAELYKSLLGNVDEEFNFNQNQGQVTQSFVKQESFPHKDIETQTWKRILNNMPLLLKSKGTKQGIRNLMTAYGIPETILNIKEYGGPVDTSEGYRESVEKFTYTLQMSGSSEVNIPHERIDYDKPTLSLTNPGSADRMPSMYEFRFSTTGSYNHDLNLVNSATAYAGNQHYHWFVALRVSSSTDIPDHSKYARLEFTVASASVDIVQVLTDYAPFRDGDMWNVSFGVTEHPTSNVTNTFKVRYAKVGEHSDKLTWTGSFSATADDADANAYYIVQTLSASFGGTNDASQISNLPKPFTGSMQEIRQWAEHIGDDAFYEHALNPHSTAGDTIQSAYNDLLIRIPLGSDGVKRNHSTITVVSSSSPNTANHDPYITGDYGAATFANFADTDTYYEPRIETYYIDIPFTAGSRAQSNKIRIEDNSLRNNMLSRDKSFEVSSYDSNPLDTNDLAVVLSPADQIDLDIASQLGAFSLADYIGDPRDTYKPEYTSLRDQRNLYFKKYSDAYNIWAFMHLLKSFNKGLFKQIESLLPARADAVVGIEIRPNILERNKLTSPAKLEQLDVHYTASAINTAAIISSDARSKQTFENSEYTNFNSTINTGVRSSQQQATSSEFYKDRRYEGSEYEGVSFSEATLSFQTTYISESRRDHVVGTNNLIIPTYNIYNRPVIGNITGSGWQTVFDQDPTAFNTASLVTDSVNTSLGWGDGDEPDRPNAWVYTNNAEKANSEFSQSTDGAVFGSDTDDNSEDANWMNWGNPFPLEKNKLFKVDFTFKQLRADGDADGTPDSADLNNIYAGFTMLAESEVSSSRGNPYRLPVNVNGGTGVSSAYYFTLVALTSNEYTTGTDYKAVGIVQTATNNLPGYGINSGDSETQNGRTSINNGKRAMGILRTRIFESQSSGFKWSDNTHFTPQFLINYQNDEGQTLIKEYKVRTLNYSDVNPSHLYSDSYKRFIIDGTKVTSPDFNEASSDTIDGGPSVEFDLVNPNILTVSDDGDRGPTLGTRPATGLDRFGNTVSLRNPRQFPALREAQDISVR